MQRRHFLTSEQIIEFKQLYRNEKSSIKKYKIKAILFLNKGYSYKDTAEFLFIEVKTIMQWHNIFKVESMEALLENKNIERKIKLTPERMQLHLKRIFKIKKIPLFMLGANPLSVVKKF